jgi:hypothetical protein
MFVFKGKEKSILFKFFGGLKMNELLLLAVFSVLTSVFLPLILFINYRRRVKDCGDSNISPEEGGKS